MKRISLSKSFRTLGLMAMLSVLVAANLQQPVRAQSKAKPKADATCETAPDSNVFFEFQGIKFSPKQLEAELPFRAKRNKRVTALFKNARTVTDPNGTLTTVIKEENRSEKSSEEVLKAASEMSLSNRSVAEQVSILTKKYGKYATFSISNRIVLTQKQVLEKDSIERDYEAQILSILTPEQQKTYQANILVKRCYEARLNWT